MSASALYELQISEGESSNGPDGEQLMSSKSNSQGDTSAKNEKSKDKKKDRSKKRRICSCKKEHIGPYELLAKHRLMGIYLAVFIYRDLKPLVRGKIDLLHPRLFTH